MFLAQLRHVSVSCRWVPGTARTVNLPFTSMESPFLLTVFLRKIKFILLLLTGPRLPTLDPTIVKKDELLWWT